MTPAAPPKRVLIVDDEIASDIAVWLRPPRWEATEATGVDDAKAKLTAQKFDVVVLDMIMPFPRNPEEAGLAVLEYIDQIQPGLPVLVLTALSARTVAWPALELGAAGYLYKEDFQRHLESLLDRMLDRIATSLIKESQPGDGPQAPVVEKTRKLIADVKESRRVQRAALPLMLRIPRTNNALTIAGSNIRRIGASGDTFDFLLDPARNRAAFLVCDVTDKGVSRSLVASRMCGAFRAAVRHGCTLEEIDLELNEIPRDFHSDCELFAEGSVGMLDLNSRRVALRFAGALPLTLRTGTRVETISAARGGLWWGVENAGMRRSTTAPTEFEFNAGHSLVFVTDGILDASNSRAESFGKKKVEECHAAFRGMDARALSEWILHRAIEFAASDSVDPDSGLVLSLDDDATVLAINWA